MLRLLRNSSRLIANGNVFPKRFSHTIKFEDPDFNCKYLTNEYEGIAVFGMTRAKAKNSFSRNMLNQFQKAIETVKHDMGVRAVIIRSEVPGIFCAGADLKERAKMTPEEVRHRALAVLIDFIN